MINNAAILNIKKTVETKTKVKAKIVGIVDKKKGESLLLFVRGFFLKD